MTSEFFCSCSCARTSQPPCALYSQVDGLETGQESVVVVGADFILVDEISVQIVQLSVSLLHRRPEGKQMSTSRTNRGETTVDRKA